MNTNTQTTITLPKRRVFTMIHRSNTIVLADNKPNKEGYMTAKTVTVEDGAMEFTLLKKLTGLVNSIPTQKLDRPVVILVPNTLSFLTFEDTRKFWLANGAKKTTGEVIPAEKLALVAELDKAITLKTRNILFLGQSKITSPYYRTILSGAWKFMDSIVAPEEKLNAMEFDL